MNYVLFSIAAYIFMRAFQVALSDKAEARWYRISIKIVAILVLYTAVAAMVVFYVEGLAPLGFSSE